MNECCHNVVEMFSYNFCGNVVATLFRLSCNMLQQLERLSSNFCQWAMVSTEYDYYFQQDPKIWGGGVFDKIECHNEWLYAGIYKHASLISQLQCWKPFYYHYFTVSCSVRKLATLILPLSPWVNSWKCSVRLPVVMLLIFGLLHVQGACQ